MLAFDAPVPPSLDLGIDLLVQVPHRARAHPGAPERLRDVLYPPYRDPSQILAPQFRYLQADVASLRVQRSFIATSTGILSRLATLITPYAAQPIGFGI
jgi:hypothetical protein